MTVVVMAKQVRAAVYVRVSTDGQTVENQRQALEAVAARRGWTVTAEYADEGVSGTKGRDKRAALDKMMKDAGRGRFDIVLVWAVDRLGRSTATVAPIMADLAALGVGLYADREGMDATSAHGRAMLQMASVFAELERAMIVDRVHAGLNRARAAGVKLGRKPIDLTVEGNIRKALADGGKGMLKIAAEFGVGSGTVQRIKKTMKAA